LNSRVLAAMARARMWQRPMQVLSFPIYFAQREKDESSSSSPFKSLSFMNVPEHLSHWVLLGPITNSASTSFQPRPSSLSLSSSYLAKPSTTPSKGM